MSTHVELFYAYTLENIIHCTFIVTFLCSCFLRVFFLTVLSNLNNPKQYLTGTTIAIQSGPLGVIAMKGYFTLPRSSGLKLPYQIQFIVIHRTFLFFGIVGV